MLKGRTRNEMEETKIPSSSKYICLSLYFIFIKCYNHEGNNHEIIHLYFTSNLFINVK